ncbi:MAG: tol-pal system YbgF family protein, partial [bacterium]
HRHYLSGLLSARLGQNDEALQAADALQAQSVMFSRDGAREKAAARARDYALSIRVQLATNDGKYKEALTLLDRRQPETWWSMVAFVLSTSQAYERYLRAESHFALGEYDEALRWYSSLGYGASREFVYSPVSHLKRAEIYEKLGQFETALKHYTRFVWFWKNCDLELKPLVDEIQLRIEQLKSGPLAKK